MRMKGKEELPGEFFFFLSLEILLDENIWSESWRMNRTSPKDNPKDRYCVYQVYVLGISGHHPQK